MSGSSLGFFAGGATCIGDRDCDFFEIIELFDEEDTFSNLLPALALLMAELWHLDIFADSSNFLLFKAAAVAVTDVVAVLASFSLSTVAKREGR